MKTKSSISILHEYYKIYLLLRHSESTGGGSPAKRGSPTPVDTPVGSPLLHHVNEDGLCFTDINGDLVSHHDLKVKRSLFDRSSGDSANISEAESAKMGDSPGNFSGNVLISRGLPGQSSSDGEVDVPKRLPKSRSETKDIGYSSESPSNDDGELMRHQIDLEYKFPGKCEVSADAPLGKLYDRLDTRQALDNRH